MLGKMTWADSASYDGEYRKGIQHGMGVEHRANGTLRHKGRFEDGIPVGGNYSHRLTVKKAQALI